MTSASVRPHSKRYSETRAQRSSLRLSSLPAYAPSSRLAGARWAPVTFPTTSLCAHWLLDSHPRTQASHSLGNVPHDWLFEHVSAVVHHGGAGTTAIGVRLGRPTVVGTLCSLVENQEPLSSILKCRSSAISHSGAR
jgi:hypothetical protein